MAKKSEFKNFNNVNGFVNAAVLYFICIERCSDDIKTGHTGEVDETNTDMTEEFPNKNCGVNEEMFPCLGKCCGKNDAVFMNSYDKICPYCDISPSLPCGTDLRITTIFECLLHGYGRRISQ